MLNGKTAVITGSQRQMAVMLWRGGGPRAIADNESPVAGLARQIANASCEHALALIEVATRLQLAGLTIFQENALSSLKLLGPLHGRQK